MQATLLKRLQLNQKETPTQVFSCKIYEIFKSTYFEEYVRVAASRGTLVYFTQTNQWNKNIWIYVWIFLKVGRGRVGGSSIFRWTRNEDFWYGISTFWEKKIRITRKNKEKSGSEIMKNGISIFGHLLKKWFFAFNFCQVVGTLWRLLKSQNVIL